MKANEKQLLLQMDRQHVWHPFTQMKDYADTDPVLIEKAEGVYLYDADGNRYYDTNSSWWVNVHGHAHPRIREAINRQLAQMDHVMFAGLTHRPGIELAHQLVELTPPGLDRVFYSDNGSTSVEVALKMSFQYWQQTGRTGKTKFAFVENSYHGDTIGAVSVGGVDHYFSVFRPLLFAASAVPSPDVRKGPSAEACVAEALEGARKLFESSADELAALIVEPMIQAAGGMIIYPAAYLQGLRELCTQYEVHLIADEVAVGFGRTGRMFACDHAGISPDFMCLSKGLTAGVLPLSATITTNAIYDAFYDDYVKLKTFTHGHSFTGNPLAAAVALESLRIFEEERVLDHVQDAAAHLKEQLKRFEAFSGVANVRSLGMVGAFELYKDRAAGVRFDFAERIGFRVYLEGLKEGLFLRPLGDTIYYWLPLCTTKKQIDDIVARTETVLKRMGFRDF
ncbi:adenosylmethionine--8-amino-7-oxononanoate transaminase [Paenibacillus naphthalenovorans]|uniref:Adenosylmethionine-8-amino-7-oxononanoate aminotransferase n=1 Tax=Paenibacillus naphthalenovorans TaxID=162209 RepID=A0A0U2UMB4_9BACL|nr:adenosylmethionine--8-amino-7-oxononanoate transaminase [Paenibacillus naphthalenovorans]ALS24236.1 adenosylmethionine--8-amino-7-oxononanoate aminotransferase BioA [Paenibacillus naphthalenovorans]